MNLWLCLGFVRSTSETPGQRDRRLLIFGIEARCLEEHSEVNPLRISTHCLAGTTVSVFFPAKSAFIELGIPQVHRQIFSVP
jgi:hypothetical protein